MIKNPMNQQEKEVTTTAAKPSMAELKQKAGEKIAGGVQDTGSFLQSLWRSRMVWSAVASIVTVFNPTIGKAITLLANLFLGV